MVHCVNVNVVLRLLQYLEVWQVRLFPLLSAITGVITYAGPAGSYVTVVGWDNGGQSAFIRPCIEYNRVNGQFRVIQDGTYVVISRLAFMSPNSGLVLPQRSSVYGQRIMRVNFTEPVAVDLQLRPTDDLPHSSVPVHVSTATRVARLRAGRLLYVEAKPVDQLARENFHSTFSLVKL